ncbi:hypothetical protein M527_29250 [Sphingobium indicum IP26]|uniref:hypothetical protein n=1 Tax=Sphingobium sp. HDIP04 TaxID=428994 RepID=UPI0003801A20|nr:hypothetical protein [Sphingobium sp. HDIP04]EPR14202.1 hypothetical protein M527_29250 [Sphingobium indicum IP26]EQB03685.1 hypothetical protein L286_11715 [Sphingobium sp. HDIP04]
MKIKVLRDYSGAEGTDVDKNVIAGSTHIVTRARAAELKAVGLVEIVGEDEHPDDGKEDEEVDEKKIQPIANKAAHAPRNKAEPKANDKTKGASNS